MRFLEEMIREVRLKRVKNINYFLGRESFRGRVCSNREIFQGVENALLYEVIVNTAVYTKENCSCTENIYCCKCASGLD